jgi:hypothetical protein
MKTLIAFLALSLCAAAQTSTNVPTVTLSGEVHDPMIENHSGKQVIAVSVTRNLADGTHTVAHRLFTHEANQLPDGGSVKFGEYSTHLSSQEISAKITAVIFADGEFRGEDSYEFRAEMEGEMQTMRQIWQMAKTGDWAGVKGKAEAKDPDIVSLV